MIERGERCLEAAQVRAAFEIADVVGEGADVFRVAVVVLDGDADFGLVDAAFDADHVGVNRAFSVRFRCLTNSTMPSWYWNSSDWPVRSSETRIRRSGRKKCQLLQPLVQDVVAELRCRGKFADRA